VRERFAGQVRAADVRSSDAPPERTAEQERAETLRASFRPEAERTPADRREELRAKFMRTQAAEAAKDAASDAAARREALRESFAKEGQTAPKTPEQLRQAMQERDKPAAERRQDKDRGHEIER
jgi:hypothetical protein